MPKSETHRPLEIGCWLVLILLSWFCALNIAGIGCRDRASQLVNDITHGSPSESIIATQTLGKTKDIRAIDLLIDVLRKDSDAEVGHKAAKALGEIGE